MNFEHGHNIDRRRVTTALSAMLFTWPLLLPGHGIALANADAAPTFHGYRRTFVEMRPRPPAPTTPLLTESGGVTNIVRMAKTNGRVILINFWATWCPTCLQELPTLDRLQAIYSETDLRVIPVSGETVGFARMRAYFNRLSIANLDLFRDPDNVSASALGVNHGLPYSFIIDRNGMVAGYMAGGADWDSPDARNLIQYFIDR